ncbi:hypothetical protein D3P96_05325 [Weissella viridescens]|uniref:Uncharacterized protein n=1 Tax=Weissella viridescens TaxID=1629 RepID=A0A3P2RG68_WEIVI|nr:hypothetical protein [Weissella viridescens]RRG17820.1 hypothetical protein D3P96_05325 [Weissella viridescens]
MADRIDKLLERYFTGGLDLDIKMREQELRQPISKKMKILVEDVRKITIQMHLRIHLYGLNKMKN